MGHGSAMRIGIPDAGFRRIEAPLYPALIGCVLEDEKSHPRVSTAVRRLSPALREGRLRFQYRASGCRRYGRHMRDTATASNFDIVQHFVE